MDMTGTLEAQYGAMERILNPHFVDAVFPVIAFLLVIVIPSTIAIWAIVKTVTQKELGEGES